MSEPTVIDAEFEETEPTEVTLEYRVKELEKIAKHLLEEQKSVLSHFRETLAILAENILASEVHTEISEESSEE